MAKSKFFRAFTAGQTISDGRTITAEMIDQVVATFNAETYLPGINVEHIRGFSPETPFNRYGDVIAVKAQDDDITVAGKTEKRRALYAQVEANDQLVALATAGQKPFPSVELTPDYAGTKQVGLVGLAFTDSPASIATQKLSFSRAAAVHGTSIARGEEAVALEFEAGAPDSTGIVDAIKNGFAGLAGMFKAEPEKPKDEPKPEHANDNDAKFAAAVTKLGETLATAIKPIADAQASFRTEFDAFKTKVESTEAGNFNRPPATGAGVEAKYATDC